jgi:hypothetical protein
MLFMTGNSIMKKKPIHVSEGAGVGLDEDTQVDVSTNGATPVHDEGQQKLREAIEEMDAKYADVFKRLAE